MISDDMARNYFDLAAPNYRKRSSSFPWSMLRKRELAAVISCFPTNLAITALDLGAGSGFYSQALKDWGATRVVAVDTSATMIANLPDGVEGLVDDACLLRLSERFDLVICAGLMEFLSEPECIFDSVAYHLGPDGRVILLFPLDNILGRLYASYHEKHGIQVRLFCISNVKNMSKCKGFSVICEQTVWPFTGIVALQPSQ